MKLKRLPNDFQVEERISLSIGSGPFALYKLSKQSLGTLEAVEAIERKWNLPRPRIAFAGLKDRHAATTQYLTICGGPARGMSQTNLQLQYVGPVERPIHASDIIANSFQIVVRDLDEAECTAAESALAAIAADGLPNYFDDQRFGSLGESGEFIAKPWCLGDYQRSVWLALADPNVHDRPDDRDEKMLLCNHWGQWQSCAKQLRPSVRRDAVLHLARQPEDFKRAIAIFPHALRSLWLAAFQSHLWNQLLARLIARELHGHELQTRQIGPNQLPLFARLADDERRSLQGAVLPLPSARLHLDSPALQALYDQVLAAEGLELRQVRVKYPRDTFFSKGERNALFRPGDLSHCFASDDLHARKQKLNLSFTLPRGSYATILIKRLFPVTDGIAGDPDDGVQ